jgi:hypothetical protein
MHMLLVINHAIATIMCDYKFLNSISEIHVMLDATHDNDNN